MPKDLQYGPQPFVFQSNPEWSERQSLTVDPMIKPDPDEELPKAYPIDLHHLSQQAFAHNNEAKKRWFLTAFVAPEDQYLLMPPEDMSPATQALKAIKQALEKPAHGCTPEQLMVLQQEVLALFKLDKWLGVALAMVDNKELSIDILNTLIQWQALKIQFGEDFFTLDTVASSQSQPTVHHTVFAQSQLTLEQVRASNWGKKVEPQLKEPTLEHFSKSIIHHHEYMYISQNTLHIKAPSTLMVEHALLNNAKANNLVPLYSFGFLAFEDFCAAGFLGGRPLQAYLPGAKGNLYWSHGLYFGEALMVSHDYVHACTYCESQANSDNSTFKREMKMLAVVANAMVRINMIKEANQLIDEGGFRSLFYNLVLRVKPRRTPESFELRRTLLIAIYQELALTTGIELIFSCTRDKENKDVYHLKSTYHNQTLSFTINLSHKHDVPFLDCFYRDFDALMLLAQKKQVQTNHTESSLLTQYKQKTGEASPPLVETNTDHKINNSL